MHLQIVTFNLNGISPDEYVEHCDNAAPRFAAMPGLRSKIWIAEPGGQQRGGVYLWESRRRAEEYEGFAALRANERFADVAIRDFDVLDGPTSLTRWRDVAGSA